jgi:DNA-binding transcriptional ArsR family regulator
MSANSAQGTQHRGRAGAGGAAGADPSLAHVFAALGDPIRLQLVSALSAGGALSIAQLTQGTDISRQGVTKHLNVLAEAGVVSDIRLGRERLWQLEPAGINDAGRALDAIGRQWEQALSRLKRFVEKDG